MTLAVDAVPACPPREPYAEPTPSGSKRLVARRGDIGSVEAATWDRLASQTPWSTPFSRWAFHRAWWDAYGDTAHDETLLIHGSETGDTTGDGLVGIVPLMHRHFHEPGDAAMATELRHGHQSPLTSMAPTAKVTFFGASYHADYATLVCAPEDLAPVADALAEAFAGPPDESDHSEPWDALDLRRLRCADPAVDALAAAFGRREVGMGWSLGD